jgi:polyribonucleotide nucleotidyltransferase
MSGMEFSDADLAPGEALSGATEWEDILMKHKIMPTQQAQHTEDDLYQEAVEMAKEYDVNEHKTMAELDELEDDLEDDVLAGYRARRLEEMKSKAKREIYGSVVHIREQEFVQEVSQAPIGTYVVLHLFANTSVEQHAAHTRRTRTRWGGGSTQRLMLRGVCTRSHTAPPACCLPPAAVPRLPRLPPPQ